MFYEANCKTLAPTPALHDNVTTHPLGLGPTAQQKLAELSGSQPEVGYLATDIKGPWSSATDIEKATRRSPLFFTTTWRALDPQEHPDGRKRLHLADGLWLDIDARTDSNETIEDAVKSLRVTADLIQNMGIPLACCSLFASGGKGFHVFIPIGLFIPGGVASVGINTARWWPYTCKSFVLSKLIAECTDTRIYNGGAGRLLRQPNVQRDNGLFKVALAWSEYQDLTTDTYKAICAAPRPLLEAQLVFGAAPDAAVAWMKAFKATTKPKVKSNSSKTHSVKLDLRGKMFGADLTSVKRALAKLEKVNLAYDQWLHIGMALKSTGASDALAMWEEFSKGHPKYRKGECEDRWGAFQAGSFSLGTLYFLASTGGAA